MRKLLMMVTMLLVPALASAWTLPVKVTNSSAGIAAGNQATVTFTGAPAANVVTAGTKYFYPASSVTSATITLGNPANILSVKVNGAVPAGFVAGTTGSVTVTKTTANMYTVDVVYKTAANSTADKKNITVTQGTGGLTTISIGSATTASGFTGVLKGTYVTVKTQPNAGFSAAAPVVTGATLTGDTFQVGDTDITVNATASYTAAPTVSSAYLSAPASAVSGTEIAATVVAISTGTLTYDFTTTCATGATQSGASREFKFTPSINPGTCTVTAVVKLNGAPATTVSSTINVTSGITAANYACTSCHAGSTPAVITAYNAGEHGHTGLTCQTCHNGTATHGDISPVVQLGTPATITPDANGFVTANACQKCHKDSHDEWKESLHTLKAKKGPALLNGSTENISPWAIANWNTMKTHQILGRKVNISSKNYVEMYVSVDKKQPSDVAVVIGQDRKQRYAVYYDGAARPLIEGDPNSGAYVVYSNNGGITFREKMIDDDNNPATPAVWERVSMPAQPDRAGYMFLWLEVKLTGATPAMNTDNYEEWRSWQERCIGCHTTGFDRVAYNSAKSAYVAAFNAAGGVPAGLDMRTLYVSEWEISCEACHGAGKDHAQTGDKTKIVSPAKLAKGDHIRREVCESCHTRTNKNIMDTATANDRRGFRLGVDSYSDWMDYTSPAWGTGNRQVSIDGKGRRDHQMTMDIQLSKYIHEVVEGGFSYHGNQNCFDCHKSHDVGIDKNGVNVFKTNMASGKYGHDNMTSLTTDDGVRSTLRLKDTREALCSPCHVTAAPAGVLPAGVTAPQYASVTDLIKLFDSKTGASYGYTAQDPATAVLNTALYATDPTAATAALPLVASNWATEGGRDKRQSHIFNKDLAAVPTNKAMGLKPEEYTWEIATSKVGLLTTVTSDYTAIWPWMNASTGKTKVYGPLTNLGTKPPLATRPYQP